MGSGGHAGPPPLRTLLVSPCAGDSAPCSLVNAMPPPCHRLQSAPCSLRTTAARRRRRRRRRLDCLGVAPMPRCRRCGPRTNMDHLLSHTGRDCLGLRRSTTAASVARGLQGGPARQRIWCTLTAAIPVGNPLLQLYADTCSVCKAGGREAPPRPMRPHRWGLCAPVVCSGLHRSTICCSLEPIKRGD